MLKVKDDDRVLRSRLNIKHTNRPTREKLVPLSLMTVLLFTALPLLDISSKPTENQSETSWQKHNQMASYPVVIVWRRKVTSSIHYVYHVVILCVRRVYLTELLIPARLSVLSASESYYHKSYIDR